MSDNFSTIINTIAEQKGMSQSDILRSSIPYCEKYGVKLNKNRLSDYFNGKTNPNYDKIRVLAKTLQVSADTLLGFTENIRPLKKKEPIEKSMIPIIGKVACGFTCLAEQHIEDYSPVENSILNSGYEYAWLRVTGDSMSPKIEEGDLALIRFQDDLDAGIGVVIVDEEDGLLKKIRHEPDKITLESFNPYYPPRVFIKEEMNRVRIVGKLVRTQRDYN